MGDERIKPSKQPGPLKAQSVAIGSMFPGTVVPAQAGHTSANFSTSPVETWQSETADHGQTFRRPR